MSREEDESMGHVERLWQEVASGGPYARAKALTELAYIENSRENFKDALQMCYSAREIYQGLGKAEMATEIADVSRYIVIDLDNLNRDREAAEEAQELIPLLRELDSEHLAETLRRQGRCWFAEGEYQKSIDSHLAALEVPDPDRSEISFGIDYLNIGMCYHKFPIFNYRESIEYLEKAREIFRKEKDLDFLGSCDGELAEIYLDLGMADELEIAARRVLDLAETVKDQRKCWFMNYCLGVAAKLKEDFDSAECYFETAKSRALQFGNQEYAFLALVDKELAGILIIKGRVTEANEILRRVKTVEDLLADDAEPVAA